MSRGALATELLEQFGAISRPPLLATAFVGTPGAPGGGYGAKSDEAIAEKLAGVDKDIAQDGNKEDDIINSAFGNKVIKNGLPEIDVRNHKDIKMTEYMEMGTKYPGGDVMGQLPWQKWRYFNKLKTGVSVPPEEDWYAGARLGEYAKPLIMGENKVGYLNQAPVPMSQSEDLLTLVSESGVGSRRARHAALYAKASAAQADEFFRLAQRRARQIFHDPPLSVTPGADVFPLYSAAAPALLALAAPPIRRSCSAVAAEVRPQKSSTVATTPKRRRHWQHEGFL